MNRALDPSIAEDDLRYFSMQSKNEIWWLTSCEVPKEEHEVLKVFFGIPDVTTQ